MKLKGQSICLEPADVFVNHVIDPPIWLWDEQLALGCMTLLVGPPKAGKSLFVRNLIRAVTRGESFLGKGTKCAPVAYLALEDHPSFLKRAIKDAQLDNQNLHIHYGSIFGKPDELLEYLKTYSQENGVKLIIIDPMAKFTSITDMNDYSVVYRELSKLITFAREENVHILLVHHSNKGGGDSANQIMGSNGLFGVSDGAFIISRPLNSNHGTLRSYLRYGTGIEDCRFSYNEKKELIYQGTAADLKERDLEVRILDYLGSEGKSDANKICSDLQVKREVILAALQLMEEKQLIEKSGHGVKGSKFIYSIPVLEILEREQNNGVLL